MKTIPRKFENTLRENGFCRIIGIDEVGRGAWAGPIVAAGVLFDAKTVIKGVHDSKKLTAKNREELSLEIRDKALCFSIQEIDNIEIDNIGIGTANTLVIKRVIEELKPDYALIDKAWVDHLDVPHELIIKGDSKVFTIAAASIIAKVYRDALMDAFHEQYPHYAFNENKGYGTKDHQDGLDKHSYCPIHRKSYQPILQSKLI